MKIKKSIYIIAIVAGLITAFLTISLISKTKNQNPTNFKSTEVIVAIKDIPANTEITNEMITTKEVLTSNVQENAIRSSSEAVGKITSSKIVSGDQIITERLAIGQANTAVSYTIPENMRAISIPIKEVTGVAGYISIGDKIDILINDSVEGSFITSTELQNIMVLQKGINPGNDQGLVATNESITDSLTILVTPSQAEVVAFALSMNSPIVVTLRNPIDKAIVPSVGYGESTITSWRGR